MKNIRVEKKTSVRNNILRMTLFMIAVVLQLVWILSFFGAFENRAPEWDTALKVAAVLMALWIYGKDQNNTKQIPWIMLILVFPIVGFVLYVLTGRSGMLNKVRDTFEEVDRSVFAPIQQDEEVMEALRKRSKVVYNQSSLIHSSSSFPMYQDTDITYYADAVDGFQAQIDAMKEAKQFIFMEYHAIEDAESFQRMKKVLIQKAKEGLDIRIVYDEMGSVGFINREFISRMKELGIQCRVFNPMRPLLLIFMNNRDHRKITIVDGKIGFTGGYNIANEYFNLTHPYGYWKDTGIRLEGLAVNSLTATFLEMWNALSFSDADPSVFYKAEKKEAKGFVQPYADSPLDNEYVGENVYMDMIHGAKDYIYFCTPYLIVTDEMTRALTLAAKRGVDVRIITPGVPDKRLTYAITRSFYYELATRGVEIYEYVPGFCHAKMCLCDDEIATVGTINMDYRSFYLNFENGVYLYRCPAIKEIRKDFSEMFRISENVTQNYQNELSMPVRTFKAVLRLVAPLF